MPEGDSLGFGLLGGILGGLGGFFGSRSRRKRFEEFKRNQATAITQAREEAERRVGDLLDDPLVSGARDFIGGIFSGDIEETALGEQFRKRLRVAQEARGLRRSAAGAVAEASSLAAFRQRLAAQLLPEAARFGTLGERFRGRILSQETPLRVAQLTGAPVPGITPLPIQFEAGPLASAFGQATSGFLGGLQIGQSFQSQDRFLDELRLLREARTPRLGEFSPFEPQTPTFFTEFGDVLGR